LSRRNRNSFTTYTAKADFIEPAKQKQLYNLHRES
jgi:hypothetical protein